MTRPSQLKFPRKCKRWKKQRRRGWLPKQWSQKNTISSHGNLPLRHKWHRKPPRPCLWAQETQQKVTSIHQWLIPLLNWVSVVMKTEIWVFCWNQNLKMFENQKIREGSSRGLYNRFGDAVGACIDMCFWFVSSVNISVSQKCLFRFSSNKVTRNCDEISLGSKARSQRGETGWFYEYMKHL